jgi:hypothetical protein
MVRYLAGLAALLGLGLAGCATSATYLGSPQQDFYFKVPPGWHVYDAKSLQGLGLPSTSEAAQLQAQGSSYPAFTSLASPVKDLGKAGLAGPHPWALGVVLNLGGQDQAGISLSSLQDEIFNVDSASQSGVPVIALFRPKVVVKGALRGTLVGYMIDAGTTAIAFEQEALVNTPTNKLWLLAAGCSPACFVAHHAELQSIIKTFTVTADGA